MYRFFRLRGGRTFCPLMGVGVHPGSEKVLSEVPAGEEYVHALFHDAARQLRPLEDGGSHAVLAEQKLPLVARREAPLAPGVH